MSKLSYKELWDAVHKRELATIDDWVSEGRHLYDGRGMTIYHVAVQCGSVDFIEELVRRHPHTAYLIVRGNEDGGVSSLHWCCMFATREGDDGHCIGMLDALCGIVSDIALGAPSDNYNSWMDFAKGDKRIQEYIEWRKEHGSGLPPEIRRLNNKAVLQYIQTFGCLSEKSAAQYKEAIKGKTETSYCIRMVFLGHEGVGKTTLMYRMTCQDIKKVKPTNQLDVLLNLLIVDLLTKECKLLHPWMEQEVTRQRLRDVVVDSIVTGGSTQETGDKDSTVLDNSLSKAMKTADTTGDTKKPKLKSPDLIVTSLSVESDIEASNVMSDMSPDLQEAAVMMTSGPTEDFGKRGQKAYVSVFDFGGEIMFSTFQHIFLNTNAVILLCFSLHDCLQKDSILDRVIFWLRFLSTFSDKDGRYHPPVLLVGTHLDKVNQEEKDSIKDLVCKQIKKDSVVARAYDQHVVQFVTVDSTVSDKSGYKEIWDLVLEAAKYQSQWGQILPASWITLERDLVLQKSQGIKVMTLEEVKSRAKNLVVPVEEKDVMAMLGYLHIIRTILGFKLDNPKARIILDPQWLIKAFRMIVTTIKFQQEGIDPKLVEEYKKTKQLSLAFISAVWSKDKKENFLHFEETLLFYLERLALIVKPLPKEDETSVDYYIVPCLLEQPTPELFTFLLEQKGTVKTSTLCFDFRGCFIPPAVFNKILASCVHRFEVLPIPNQSHDLYLQQGLACFVLSRTWKMLLHCKDSFMKLTLFSTSAKKVEAGIGYHIRIIMEAIVRATMKQNNQGHLEFDFFLSEDFLVKPGEQMTKVGPKSNVLHYARNIESSVWFSEHHKQDARLRSPSGAEARLLSRCPVPREIIRIVKHVGNTYTLFFGVMGMNEVRVQQLREQYEHGQKLDFLSVLARIMFAWKDELGNKATFRLVKNAFELCDLDLMEMMDDIRKLNTYKDAPIPKDIGLPVKVLNSRPTDKELPDISMIILKAYFIVFIELNLSCEDIELAEMKECRPINLICSLIRLWMKKSVGRATILQLYLALKECRRNYTKLIELMMKRS